MNIKDMADDAAKVISDPRQLKVHTHSHSMHKQNPVDKAAGLKMAQRHSTLPPRKFNEIEKYGDDQVNVHVGNH